MTSKRTSVFAMIALLLAGMTFFASGHSENAISAQKGSVLTFEVYKDKGGDFRYRIVDDTGANLGGAAKGYGKKEDVLKVVNAIKKGAAAAKIDDQSTKK